MTRRKQRVLSFFLTLVMVLSLFPTQVFATGSGANSNQFTSVNELEQLIETGVEGILYYGGEDTFSLEANIQGLEERKLNFNGQEVVIGNGAEVTVQNIFNCKKLTVNGALTVADQFNIKESVEVNGTLTANKGFKVGTNEGSSLSIGDDGKVNITMNGITMQYPASIDADDIGKITMDARGQIAINKQLESPEKLVSSVGAFSSNDLQHERISYNLIIPQDESFTSAIIEIEENLEIPAHLTVQISTAAGVEIAENATVTNLGGMLIKAPLTVKGALVNDGIIDVWNRQNGGKAETGKITLSANGSYSGNGELHISVDENIGGLRDILSGFDLEAMSFSTNTNGNMKYYHLNQSDGPTGGDNSDLNGGTGDGDNSDSNGGTGDGDNNGSNGGAGSDSSGNGGNNNSTQTITFSTLDELESALGVDGQSSILLTYSGNDEFKIDKDLPSVPANIELSFGSYDLKIARGNTFTVNGKVSCRNLTINGTLNANGSMQRRVNAFGNLIVNGTLVINGEIFCGTAMKVNGTVENHGKITVQNLRADSGDKIISIGSDGNYTNAQGAKLQIESSACPTKDALETLLEDIRFNIGDYNVTEKTGPDGKAVWELSYTPNGRKLGTPTDLQWGIAYRIDEYQYDPVTGELTGAKLKRLERPGAMSWRTKLPDQAMVRIKLYRAEDNTRVADWGVTYDATAQPEYRTSDWFMVNEDDLESGDYYFTVQSIADGINFINSDIAKSGVYHYVKANNSLDKCLNPTWEDRNVEHVKWMKWKADPRKMHVDGYQTEYAYSATKNGNYEAYNSSWNYKLKKTDRPFEDLYLQQNGTGYYKFRVRALSNNIENYGNGQWSAWSDPLDMSNMPANVTNDLRRILNNASHPSMNEDAIRETVQQMDSNKLRATLLTDTDNTGATATLAEIEEEVGGAAAVNVRQGVSEFKTDEISIVGANLNKKQNASNQAITLILDEPENEHIIPERFDSTVAVKFSMNLTDVEDPKHLEVPVKITLPVPENINPEYLVIIHYHQDGTWTQEWPLVYEKDGKIYADFVLTSFSDFVIAEETSADDSQDDNGNSGSVTGNGGSTSSGSSSGNGRDDDYDNNTPKAVQNQKPAAQVKPSFLPEYVVYGSWTSVNGKWTFSDSTGETFRSRWAAVYNPYANIAAGQSAFDWFHFDSNGHMATGWLFDSGLWYYLNPSSDGTQGRMLTGWQLIDGKWYYLNPVSDGTKGAMMTNTWIDTYYVDENGLWDETKTK